MDTSFGLLICEIDPRLINLRSPRRYSDMSSVEMYKNETQTRLGLSTDLFLGGTVQ
jgi:hypothetical protein